ncbi:hypothetical protein [Priestia megaterium]|uniref:Uncharacterized protein n=1 Tax=Priestia megaterium TaxID=1404 RepID=A0A6M6DNM8_PRIMG|nr:hypothetical protein [Priestia megaterium]QJX74694.1 hypothetical protein FDZ14_00310 [Priestia megaterium]
MRTIYGYIKENGTIASSGGNMEHFHVTKVSTGVYDVHFEPHFQNTPAVVATQLWEKSGPLGGSALDNVVLVSLSNSVARFKTGDGAGDSKDRQFTFIAMGE